jgi:hypothetical protein
MNMTQLSPLLEQSSVRVTAQIAAGVLALSCAYEGMVLAGVGKPGAAAYSMYHLGVMGLLLAMSVWVVVRTRFKSAGALPVTGLLSVGLGIALIGDVLNSSISPVEGTPEKLTWALLWFGLGYSAYAAFLGLEFAKIPAGSRKRALPILLIAIPVLAVANYLSWSSRIEPLVASHNILKSGSLIFSVTLYVALPALSLAILVGSRWSTGALVLLIGAGLLAFSDLILFATWLPGDESVSLEHYALNWIFYFGGQSLFFIGAISHSATDTA